MPTGTFDDVNGTDDIDHNPLSDGLAPETERRKKGRRRRSDRDGGARWIHQWKKR